MILLVAGAGVWGAASTTRSIEAYRHAQRAQSALEQGRYALALERSSVRDPNKTRGRLELESATASFSDSLTRLLRTGNLGEAELAGGLRSQESTLVRTAETIFALRRSDDQAADPAILRSAFDRRATKIDRRMAAALANVADRGAQSWPAEPRQKLALGAVLLLVVFGLAASAVFLLRLAGYRRRLFSERRDKLAELEEAALTDSLTGLGNHRAFHDDLKREMARRARTGSCFGVVMLDLDGLKQINDTLGHQAGDDRIRAVGSSLRKTVRAADSAYRTGGDEFMVLLPGERAFGGLTFAQRLQAEVVKAGKAVGVSCGVVESDGLESVRSLMRRADLALYEAKRTGRRIVVYSDGIQPRPTDRPEDLALRRHHRLLATALAQAVDAKDVGTRNHCETVSALCVLIGQALGLGGERLEQLRLAGLLHDVGKIGIADALLRKPTALDPDERRSMCSHVELGQSIVAAAGLDEEARWIRHHHEHFDGSGYPDGLSGSTIPLESRIILVADAFEAMTADRPYRAARLPAEAVEELELRAGSQFDPTCVEALRAVLDADDGLPSPERDELASWLAPDPSSSRPSSRLLAIPKKETAQ
jgi:diguanylate cyclase (GGDEF)-like protein